jgi:hypothetical protein
MRIMDADRRLKPSGYKVEGRCPEFWDEIFSQRLAMEGLHLVAVGFTPWSAAKDTDTNSKICNPSLMTLGFNPRIEIEAIAISSISISIILTTNEHE